MARYTDGIDLNAILANAPGNSVIWNRFLAELTRQLGCNSSALLMTDLVDRKNTRFLFSSNITQAYQEQYESEYNRQDNFNFFISKNPKHIFYNQSVKDAYNEEGESNFLPSCERKYRFGVAIPCTNHHSLNLIVNRNKAFTDQERQQTIRILQVLIPSLEEAIHEEQRLKINSQLLHYIGNHFDGFIIVDRELNILFYDPVYISIISQLDCVEITGSRFNMKNPVFERRLLSSLKKSEEVTSIHNQCHSCQITLIPISSLKNLYQWECYKDGFILTFTHNKEHNPIINRLTDIYHLSKCEAVCALHFMKTPSISDVATNTYRSQETVRNHIKHTMQKMEVHNQAELMKKLITLAAL